MEISCSDWAKVMIGKTSQKAKTESFLTHRGGSIATAGALLLPVVLLLTAGTLEFAVRIQQEQTLQATVDAAALAAAKELSLSSANEKNVPAAIENYVKSYYKAHSPALASVTDVSSVVDMNAMTVSVDVVQPYKPPFGDGIGLSNADLTVKSVAQIVGQPNICILALNSSSNGTIDLQHNALVTGNNCAVFSNSTHNIGIKAKNSARLMASSICSAGGFQNSGANFSPTPLVDCPQFSDPLKSRTAPAIGACDPTLPTEVYDSRTLEPGTYCQDLTIGKGAVVELNAGTYVFKGARLVVDGNAEVRGKDVGFYFDKDSEFHFAPESEISIEAPVSGAMAGLVIFTAHDMKAGTSHSILSENAQNIVGTIYMPTAELRIDGSAQIGGDAAYTALVVHDLKIYGGPHIVLNTDYNKTDVPVPDGIRGAGQPVRLIQ
jgi:hypothetical protein